MPDLSGLKLHLVMNAVAAIELCPKVRSYRTTTSPT